MFKRLWPYGLMVGAAGILFAVALQASVIIWNEECLSLVRPNASIATSQACMRQKLTDRHSWLHVSSAIVAACVMLVVGLAVWSAHLLGGNLPGVKRYYRLATRWLIVFGGMLLLFAFLTYTNGLR